MTKNKIRKLNLNDVEIRVVATPNQEESPEDFFPAEMASKISRSAYTMGNKWAWCSISIYIEWNSFLGMSSMHHCHFESEKAFKEDACYSEMLAQALNDLNEKIQIRYDLINTLLVYEDTTSSAVPKTM